MDHLSACPICASPHFSPYLSCKDHVVSHETFQLQKCLRCGFVVTNPRPADKDLPAYYESDAYISHSDTSRSPLDTLYKFVRNFTLRWKYQLLVKNCVSKPLSVLDYGCGTGAFLEQCQTYGIKTFGVEPSEAARNTARRKTTGEIVEDADKIRGTYDAITLWHVLEHIKPLHETISTLKHALQENGTMFIAVPNHHSMDAVTYGSYWAGYDVPRHLWHFSKETMELLLGRHDLQLIRVLPMPLDAFYVSLLSEKYRNGNYNARTVAKAFAQGWKSNQAAKRTKEYSSLIYIVRK